MARSRDDHVVADGLEDADRRAVHLGVRDHRGEVVGRVGAAILGQGDEVLEEVLDRRHELFGRRAACHLGVGRAEQLLRELEQAREVVLGKAEDREDHVERVVHGDVAGEVAFATEVGHAVDVALGELGDAVVEPRQRLRQEPVGRDVAIDGVIGRVHVDQRAQHVAGDRALVVALLRPEQRTRGVQPLVVLSLDLHDVGVLGDRVEGIEALDLDAVHRRLTAQERARGMKARLVGVGRGVGEDPTGVLDSHLGDHEPHRS